MSRYKAPQAKSSPYITPEGYARLKDEYHQLFNVRRPEVVRALSAAAAEGDRSENAEYIYRKKELREIDRLAHRPEVMHLGAVGRVVVDDHEHVRAQAAERLELGEGEQRAAVAEGGDGQPVGPRERGADRVAERQADALEGLREDEAGYVGHAQVHRRPAHEVAGVDDHRAHQIAENRATLGLANLVAIGLAKKEELIFTRDREAPIAFAPNDPALLLLQQARDEAHRFAVTFHRKARSMRDLRSELDSIPGVGARRRKTLLTEFGSLAGVRRATREELMRVVGPRVADAVIQYFARA